MGDHAGTEPDMSTLLMICQDPVRWSVGDLAIHATTVWRMLCAHLRPLEQALQAARIRETSRGTPWSQNCREWVYFDVRLDVEALQLRFAFPPCVVVHENTDPRSGLEKGFFCEECHDAVMGLVRGGETFP